MLQRAEDYHIQGETILNITFFQKKFTVNIIVHLNSMESSTGMNYLQIQNNRRKL